MIFLWKISSPFHELGLGTIRTNQQDGSISPWQSKQSKPPTPTDTLLLHCCFATTTVLQTQRIDEGSNEPRNDVKKPFVMCLRESQQRSERYEEYACRGQNLLSATSVSPVQLTKHQHAKTFRILP